MKYRLFILFTAIYLIIFGILLEVLFGTSPPDLDSSFYEIISATYVNSRYHYMIPTNRVIFEPFMGVFTIFLESDQGIPSLILIYISMRLLAWRLNKMNPQIKLNLILKIDILERWTTLFGVIFFGGIISIFLFLIIYGLITYSFMAIGLYAFRILEWFVRILWISFITISIFHILSLVGKDAKVEAGWRKIQEKYWIWRSKRKLYKFVKSKSYRSRILRESRRLLSILSIIGFCYFIGWFSPYIPKQITTDLAENEFLFDFHVHTSYSDGSIPPNRRVDWYIGHGIHGAAISDHHSIYGALEAEAYVQRNHLNFTVIIAQEYTISEPRIHLNIYGLRENINPIDFLEGIPLKSPYYDSKFLNVSDMIKYVKEQGGYVTVNHYGGIKLYTWEQFRDWGVDGFEVANGGSEENKNLTQFCKDNNLILIGGSDIHGGKDLDTFVKVRLEDPANKSLDAIFAALKRGDHEIIVVEKQYGDRSAFSFLNPKMFKYFSGLNMSQRISWMAWIFISYFIACGFYVLIRKRIIKIVENSS